MEACGSAHYWGRQFKKLGRQVQLIPPHLVAKYRSGNKNDKNDACAIDEASRNPNLYFVTIRTPALDGLSPACCMSAWGMEAPFGEVVMPVQAWDWCLVTQAVAINTCVS